MAKLDFFPTSKWIYKYLGCRRRSFFTVMVLLQKKRAVLARVTQKSDTKSSKKHTQKSIQTVFTKNREIAYRSTSQFRRQKITRGREIAGLPSLERCVEPLSACMCARQCCVSLIYLLHTWAALKPSRLLRPNMRAAAHCSFASRSASGILDSVHFLCGDGKAEVPHDVVHQLKLQNPCNKNMCAHSYSALLFFFALAC